MDRGWRSDAACRDVDPNIFFDEATTSVALDVCRRCCVQAECLDYALTLQIPDGVWGGIDLGAEARQREREARNRRARKTRRQLRKVLPQDPTCPHCDDNLGVFQLEHRCFRCIGCGTTWKVA